jgi:hypothetical protein
MLATLLLGLALQTPPTQEFPAILWRKASAPSDLQRSFGSVCISRTDGVEELRAAGVDFLVFNAPGRDELHLERERDDWEERRKRWLAERDPSLCRREPCLADPATLERLRARLAESLAARDGEFGLGYSLGDEVGLTPGGIPEEVCTCEHCELAWALEHARETAPAPPRLAEIRTDAVLRSVFDGELSAMGRWLERREFHQRQLVDLLEELAQQVHATARPTGLLGISGQSAFGGVAVERVLPFLDFLECYRTGNARELALTLRRPEQKVYLTVFTQAGPHAATHAAWEHWMHGGDGVFVWSEADLASKPEVAPALLATLETIRALPRFRPRPEGLAILHSGRSVAAGWLRDALLDGSTWPQRFQSWQEAHGTVETARTRWFDFARRAGAMPGALPIEALAPEHAARFPVLVASELCVLDPEDLDRLRAFRAAGGRICVDGAFGWIRSTGEALGDSARASLLESGTLLEPPEGLRNHVPGQCETDEQRAWFVRNGATRVPIETEPTASACDWTWTWSRVGERTLVAALPREPERVERTLRLRPIEGRSVTWLHPTECSGWTATIPAGSAAVFELGDAR